MSLLILPVTMPNDLKGQTNGKLGPCQLTTIWAHGWGHLSAHRYVAEAWAAMSLVCEQETGAKLTTSGPSDAYRSYEQQVSAFNRRMSPTYNPVTTTTTTRTWNGKRYWLKRGYAPVATPGTSNHGWGLALDVAIFKAGASYPAVGITSDAKVWKWIQANAQSFGFSWELASEPWHLRYYVGEKTPQRILDLRAWFEGLKAA